MSSGNKGYKEGMISDNKQTFFGHTRHLPSLLPFGTLRVTVELGLGLELGLVLGLGFRVRVRVTVSVIFTGKC